MICQLHEVTGKNRYCGPTAMATVLGISTDYAAAVARSVSGKTAIRGLRTPHLKESLEKLGCFVTHQAFPKGNQPTVVQWLKEYAGTFKKHHVILVHGHHYGTLLGNRYLCSLTKKLSVPLADIPKRRARVAAYLVVVELPSNRPGTLNDLSRVAKPTSEGLAKGKAIKLAKANEIKIEQEGAEETIWVFPPSSLPNSQDVFEADGHYCDEWSEALERVQTYVGLIKSYEPLAGLQA